MTDATDVALEKAFGAYNDAARLVATDVALEKARAAFVIKLAERGAIPSEAIKAAIEAYQAALPKGELAKELLEAAEFYDERPSIDQEKRIPSLEEISDRECKDLSRILRAAASLLGGGVPEDADKRIIEYRRHPDLPGNWRCQKIRYGSYALQVELPCINGLTAWFTVAIFHEADESERLMTDGARLEAGEYAKKITALIAARPPESGRE